MILTSLKKGASYRAIDGKKALYLDGVQGSYAETPPFPIQTISFSLLCWIKVSSLPKESKTSIHIYSDWSKPHPFRLFVYAGRLYANLRRRHLLSSSNSLVYFTGG